MNLLVDQLPQSVTVGNVDCPIDTDFRACLRSMLAFEDADLIPQEKQAVLLRNIFADEIPDDIDGALQAASWFFNCGNEEKESDGNPRVFSFGQDANFIFAAFRQTHGIDLETAQLHWWKFMALFMDLGSETTFCQLASLRKRVLTGKATKEERAAAREMGDVFTLDSVDDMSIEEREVIERFEAALAEGKKNREKEKEFEIRS